MNSITIILNGQDMFEQYNHMAQIFIKYFRGQLNSQETEKLDQWLDSDASNRQWLAEMDKEDWLDNTIGNFRPMRAEDSFNKTMGIIRKNKVIKIKRTVAVAAAAILLLSIVGIYMYIDTRLTSEPKVAKQDSSDTTGRPPIVLSNNDHATLTLADGTVVNVDNAKEEVVANQGDFKIVKDSSTLTYAHQSGNNFTAAAYNTLAIPHGAQYLVILPDGSKAWVNASSSIRFPVTDTGRIRRVEIIGQVYFEVIANPSRPFIVSTKGADIIAKGTRFNVTAYANEDTIQTDLLEGKVEVTTANQTVAHLMPGESATIIPGKSITVLPNKKIDDAIAWKNGQFVFDAETVPSIMRKLTRWYNIEVSYIDSPTTLIDGRISKKNSIESVLKLLENSNVYTTVEGNKVKVSSHKIDK